MAPDASLPPVTIQRIVDLMEEEFGIELTVFEEREVATANLNGLLVTFAILGSIAIIRAEADTEVPVDTADASWYLAANHLNSASVGASAIIVDVTPTLLVRTEAELSVAAGMSTEQLVDGLKFSIDACLSTHDAVRVAVEEYAETQK